MGFRVWDSGFGVLGLRVQDTDEWGRDLGVEGVEGYLWDFGVICFFINIFYVLFFFFLGGGGGVRESGGLVVGVG